MTPPHGSHEFHLNGLKKYLIGVAVALTAALAFQSTALVWWAATITTRMDRVERDVDGLNSRVRTIELARPAR
jgi:hypothetical protein